MQESFPGQVKDFNAYIEKQLSEKDIAKEHIMAQLATRVEANYHVLIEGMKNIQEVDLDLVSSGVQSVNSRRKLSIADHGMRDPIMKVLHKRIRRENLHKVAHIIEGKKERSDAISSKIVLYFDPIIPFFRYSRGSCPGEGSKRSSSCWKL